MFFKDPLLGAWQYGLGRSVVFTSDAKSRWAAEWLSWPGYGKFWAQVVRHSMRKSDAKGVFMQVAQKGLYATLCLEHVPQTFLGAPFARRRMPGQDVFRHRLDLGDNVRAH